MFSIKLNRCIRIRTYGGVRGRSLTDPSTRYEQNSSITSQTTILLFVLIGYYPMKRELLKWGLRFRFDQINDIRHVRA